MSSKKNTKKPAISPEEKLLSMIHGEPKAKGYTQIMHDASAAMGKILEAIDNYRDSKKKMRREGLTLLEKVGIKGVYDRIEDAQHLAEDLICGDLDRMAHDREVWETAEAEVKAFGEKAAAEEAERKAHEALIANPPMKPAPKKPAKSDKGVFYTPQEAAKVIEKVTKDAKAHVVKVAKVNGAKVAPKPFTLGKPKHNLHGVNGRFVSKKAAK